MDTDKIQRATKDTKNGSTRVSFPVFAVYSVATYSPPIRVYPCSSVVSSASWRNELADGFADLRGRGGSAQVAGVVFLVGDDGLARAVDSAGGLRLMKILEHHRHG